MSASVSRARPASTSWSIEVLCRPTFSAPAIRFSSPTRKVTPSFSAMVCASVIIFAASSRVGANWQISTSVAWHSALMGLKLRLPHAFSQISERMSASSGDLNPARVSISETRCTRSDSEPSSSPTGKRVPSMWRMTPGLAMVAAG